MIKKQSIFYGLIFLILASMGQQAHAMKWTKQQWANGFRIGMKGLNYAGIGGSFAYFLKKREKKEEEIQKLQNYTRNIKPQGQLRGNPELLSPESQDKILAFIHNAYPELKDIEIHIIEGAPLSFSVMNSGNIAYLLVPFNEEEFQKAFLCKEKNILGYEEKTAKEECIKANITLSAYINQCELYGKAMTPTTIDLWKASLLHEASHIAHRDQNFSTNPTPYIVAFVGMEKIKKFMRVDLIKYIKNPITNNMIKGIGSIISLPLKIGTCAAYYIAASYWNEYRADQDAMKKTVNPDLLKAMSKSFNTLPQFVPSTIPEKLAYYLLDTHPAHKTRAKYFAEAAQRLEAKQAQKVNQNGAKHD